MSDYRDAHPSVAIPESCRASRTVSLSLCLACLGPDCRFIACNGKKSEAQARRQGQGAEAARSMARCAVLALWFIGMQPALARAVVYELSLYPASSWSRRALGLAVTLQVSTDRKRCQLYWLGKFGCTTACRSVVGTQQRDAQFQLQRFRAMTSESAVSEPRAFTDHEQCTKTFI